MTLLDAATRRAGKTSRPALRRLLPMPVEQFAAEHWGELALLGRAETLPGGPGGFGDLLSLAAVDDLVSTRGLRTPFLRVAKDGQVIDAARWTGPGGAGAEIADQVRDDALLRLFSDGATLVLQGLHRTHPPLVQFAADLAVELGHPVQVNAYVTPPQSRGFDAHYDVHDVFVLQVAGRKRWRISRPVLEHPLRTQPWTDRRAQVAARAAEPPYLDEVLEPGDALYLPRGWLHAAEALGEVSAHVTVGIHSVTRYALAEQLLAASGSSAELRRSLPLGVDVADPAALREDLAATLEALAAAVREVPAEQVAEGMRARVWRQSRPGPVAPIAQAAAATALAEETPVVLRPALRARLVHRPDDTVMLVLPDRTLTLPRSTASALDAVLGGDPVAAAGLPGLDAADGVVLLRRLLREAVVVPAPPQA